MEGKVPARLSPAEGRKFAFTVSGALLVLGLIAWHRGRPSIAGAFAAVGFSLALAGLILPGKLDPLWRAWMGLARSISKITTPFFMGIVYFAIFAPMGWFMKLARRNPLIHRAGSDGYWIRRDAVRDAQDNLERQF